MIFYRLLFRGVFGAGLGQVILDFRPNGFVAREFFKGLATCFTTANMSEHLALFARFQTFVKECLKSSFVKTGFCLRLHTIFPMEIYFLF